MEAIAGLVVAVLVVIGAALRISRKRGAAEQESEQLQESIDNARKAQDARDLLDRNSDRRKQLRDKYRRD